MIPIKRSMTYEWEFLRFPNIVVVYSHEYDSVTEGQAAAMIQITEASHAQDIPDKVSDLGAVSQLWCEIQRRVMNRYLTSQRDSKRIH
jgi:hypothetical protein